MGFWQVEYTAYHVYNVRVEADSAEEAEEKAKDSLGDCEDYNVFGEVTDIYED